MSRKDAEFVDDPFPTDQVYDPHRVTASCTWGVAADVTVFDRFSDRDGTPSWIDLTSEQALNLAADLAQAAKEAHGHGRDYLNYCVDDAEKRAMSPADYVTCVERTLVDAPDFQIAPAEVLLSWNVLGLCGEASEVLSHINHARADNYADGLLKELGDVTWYAVAIAIDIGHEFDVLCARRDAVKVPYQTTSLMYAPLGVAANELVVATGQIADLVKKGVYHQKGLDDASIAWHLRGVMAAVDAIGGYHGFVLSDVFERNDRKLRERFPDGWDPARSSQPTS